MDGSTEVAPGNQRVAIWNRVTARKIAGNAAPYRRNLNSYLTKHPECQVYCGQDKIVRYRATPALKPRPAPVSDFSTSAVPATTNPVPVPTQRTPGELSAHAAKQAAQANQAQARAFAESRARALTMPPASHTQDAATVLQQQHYQQQHQHTILQQGTRYFPQHPQPTLNSNPAPLQQQQHQSYQQPRQPLKPAPSRQRTYIQPAPAVTLRPNPLDDQQQPRKQIAPYPPEANLHSLVPQTRKETLQQTGEYQTSTVGENPPPPLTSEPPRHSTRTACELECGSPLTSSPAPDRNDDLGTHSYELSDHTRLDSLVRNMSYELPGFGSQGDRRSSSKNSDFNLAKDLNELDDVISRELSVSRDGSGDFDGNPQHKPACHHRREYSQDAAWKPADLSFDIVSQRSNTYPCIQPQLSSSINNNMDLSKEFPILRLQNGSKAGRDTFGTRKPSSRDDNGFASVLPVASPGKDFFGSRRPSSRDDHSFATIAPVASSGRDAFGSRRPSSRDDNGFLAILPTAPSGRDTFGSRRPSSREDGAFLGLNLPSLTESRMDMELDSLEHNFFTASANFELEPQALQDPFGASGPGFGTSMSTDSVRQLPF